MLEIRKAAVTLDEAEVMELERVILHSVKDWDEKETAAFLERCVYERILQAQQGRLKSHLDTGVDPVAGFAQRTGRSPANDTRKEH